MQHDFLPFYINNQMRPPCECVDVSIYLLHVDWYLNFILISSKLPLEKLKLTRIKSRKHIKDLIAIIHEREIYSLTIEFHSDAPFRWQSSFWHFSKKKIKHAEKFVNKIDAYLWTIFKSERGQKGERRKQTKSFGHVSG